MGYTVYLQKAEAYTGIEKLCFIREVKTVLKSFGIYKAGSVEDAYNYAYNKEAEVVNYNCSASDCCAYYLEEEALYVYGPHESFVIASSVAPEFNFTKTNRKSYDGLIKVLYALARKHFNGILSHDGDKQDYWTECEEYYSEKDKKLISKFKKKYKLIEVCD